MKGQGGTLLGALISLALCSLCQTVTRPTGCSPGGRLGTHVCVRQACEITSTAGWTGLKALSAGSLEGGEPSPSFPIRLEDEGSVTSKALCSCVFAFACQGACLI